MRTTPSCTYVPPDLIMSDWVINYWLNDAHTNVLSPITVANVSNLKPSIVNTKMEPNTGIKELINMC
jgi:hypothetical protein